MLKKIDAVDKMQVCEKHLICEECPCYVFDKCLHPYTMVTPKTGNIAVPSFFNKSPSMIPGKKYIILNVKDNTVEVESKKGITEWFNSEDFILFQE